HLTPWSRLGQRWLKVSSQHPHKHIIAPIPMLRRPRIRIDNPTETRPTLHVRSNETITRSRSKPLTMLLNKILRNRPPRQLFHALKVRLITHELPLPRQRLPTRRAESRTKMRTGTIAPNNQRTTIEIESAISIDKHILIVTDVTTCLQSTLARPPR